MIKLLSKLKKKNKLKIFKLIQLFFMNNCEANFEIKKKLKHFNTSLKFLYFNILYRSFFFFF